MSKKVSQQGSNEPREDEQEDNYEMQGPTDENDSVEIEYEQEEDDEDYDQDEDLANYVQQVQQQQRTGANAADDEEEEEENDDAGGAFNSFFAQQARYYQQPTPGTSSAAVGFNQQAYLQLYNQLMQHARTYLRRRGQVDMDEDPPLTPLTPLTPANSTEQVDEGTMKKQVFFRKRLVTAGGDGQIKLWNTQTNKVSNIIDISEDAGSIYGMQFNGMTLACGCNDGTVRIFNLKTLKCEQVLKGHKHWVSSVQFDPQSKILVSGSYDQSSRVWNLSTGECLQVLATKNAKIRLMEKNPSYGYTPAEGVLCCKFSGNVVVTGCIDGHVRVWNLTGGYLIKDLQAHGARVFCLDFCNDVLVTTSWDSTIKIWDMKKNYECIRTINDAHSGEWILSMYLPRDQFYEKRQLKSFFTGGGDDNIYQWDIATGNKLRTLSGHTGGVRSLGYYKSDETDEERIVSASYDGRVIIWNLKTDKPTVLEGHESMVFAVQLGDGRRFIPQNMLTNLGNMLGSSSPSASSFYYDWQGTANKNLFADCIVVTKLQYKYKSEDDI